MRSVSIEPRASAVYGIADHFATVEYYNAIDIDSCGRVDAVKFKT